MNSIYNVQHAVSVRYVKIKRHTKFILNFIFPQSYPTYLNNIFILSVCVKGSGGGAVSFLQLLHYFDLIKLFATLTTSEFCPLDQFMVTFFFYTHSLLFRFSLFITAPFFNTNLFFVDEYGRQSMFTRSEKEKENLLFNLVSNARSERTIIQNVGLIVFELSKRFIHKCHRCELLKNKDYNC